MSQSPARPQLWLPGFGRDPLTLTSRSGWYTGSGLRSIWSNAEKMAALAPMPSARDSTAMAVTNGDLASVRKASRRFRITDQTTQGRRTLGGPGSRRKNADLRHDREHVVRSESRIFPGPSG